MTIEWWMLDGAICLIILISAILGAAKGIGDTILRIAGLACGFVLGLFYSDKVTDYLNGTALRPAVNSHLFEIIRNMGVPTAEESTEEVTGSLIDGTMQTGTDSLTESVPKVIAGTVSDMADKAAEAAAERFTDIIMGVLGFLLIVLVVWIVTALIRLALKKGRKKSFILGFTDRLTGFALGILKGIVLACLAVVALVPLVTAFAPDSLPAVMEAMEQTQITRVIYDVNPILFLLQLTPFA